MTSELGSKLWWTPNLSQLRTIFHFVYKVYRKGRAHPFEMRAAKNAYFNAIKRAKQDHWNSFVSNASSQDLWRFKKMASRNEDRVPSLPNSPKPTLHNINIIDVFLIFPSRAEANPPPSIQFRDVTAITPSEIHTVLSSTSNLSTPE